MSFFSFNEFLGMSLTYAQPRNIPEANQPS